MPRFKFRGNWESRGSSILRRDGRRGASASCNFLAWCVGKGFSHSGSDIAVTFLVLRPEETDGKSDERNQQRTAMRHLSTQPVPPAVLQDEALAAPQGPLEALTAPADLAGPPPETHELDAAGRQIASIDIFRTALAEDDGTGQAASPALDAFASATATAIQAMLAKPMAGELLRIVRYRSECFSRPTSSRPLST